THGNSPRKASPLTAGALIGATAVSSSRGTLAERTARLSRHEAMMRRQPGLAMTIPAIRTSPATTTVTAAAPNTRGIGTGSKIGLRPQTEQPVTTLLAKAGLGAVFVMALRTAHAAASPRRRAFATKRAATLAQLEEPGQPRAAERPARGRRRVQRVAVAGRVDHVARICCRASAIS